MDNQQGHTVWNIELYSMLCDSLDGRGVWGRIDTCIWIAESLCLYYALLHSPGMFFSQSFAWCLSPGFWSNITSSAWEPLATLLKQFCHHSPSPDCSIFLQSSYHHLTFIIYLPPVPVYPWCLEQQLAHHNYLINSLWMNGASLMSQMVKNLLAMQKTQVLSLGRKDPLEKEMATHSSILAYRIPWTEEPGGLWPMELQRVGHDWATNTLSG